MKLQESEISKWFDGLDDCKPEFTPVKCWNTLQFFRLRGRTTSLIASNIEPIPDLRYVVFSPKENRYYLKDSRLWNLNKLYFYKWDLDFSGQDEAVEQLRRYIYDGNVWLLFTDEQIADTKVMLARVYGSYFSNKGTVPYKVFIQLLENSLKLEEHKEYNVNNDDFKTICNQYEQTIKNLWMSVYKN